MRAISLLLLSLFAAWPTSAAGQRPTPSPRPSLLFRLGATEVTPADTLHLTPTYWKEGAIVGGSIGMAFGIYAGLEFCRYEDVDCATGVIAGGLLFGLFAAIPGALIGGQFKKSE